MADPTTTNIQLAQPTRGSDVGTWDTPVNGNAGILDLILGGVSSIGLNNSNVTLSAGQFQSGYLLFNSTLTGSVTITFPTTFIKSYEIQNVCTGTSAFTVTLATTATGGQVVACPPGEVFEVRNDGVNILFKNFGRVGEYWDYSGSSVPNWVSACTNPPYLNCDGTTFLSTQYPALSVIMGSTPAPARTVTLPDSRGRSRFALNQTTGRITSAGGFGIDGNTLAAAGGSQTIAQANLPNVGLSSSSLTVAYKQFNGATSSAVAGVGTAQGSLNSGTTQFVFSNVGTNNSVLVSTFGGSIPLGGSGNNMLPPGYVGGLTLIRAA